MTEVTSLRPGMRQLARSEALWRLSSVPFGRVVLTKHALPVIRPVSHILDGGRLIIRSPGGAAIVHSAASEHGSVLAYQADDIDAQARTGWSVVVTGLAELVGDPDEAEPYLRALDPWLSVGTGHIIRLEPEIVAGFELLPGG
jgi:hypothetical protein